MLTGKIAAEVAAKSISEGDTSKEALKQYEKLWRETSVGVEFEGGQQLWGIWRALPFHDSNMQWFVPLISELLGGIFDWSQPHTVRVRQILKRVKDLLPKALPTIQESFLPLITKALEKDLDRIPDPNILMNMLPKLLQLEPEKKKKSGGKK
jgi:flavin-dependent dehydrogenase